MSYAWYDIVGTVGVAVIVRSDQLAYSILNASGASLILISLYYDFNFPSFVVEFFWLLISLFGIGKYLLRK